MVYGGTRDSRVSVITVADVPTWVGLHFGECGAATLILIPHGEKAYLSGTEG